MKIALLSLFFSSLAFAGHLQSVQVTGDKQADVFFHFGSEGTTLPTLKVSDNFVDVTFDGADLAESLHDKVEVTSPHALLHRVSVFRPDPKVVRARLVLNGSLENLKNRLVLSKEGDGVKLSVLFPKGENAALNLLSEEQQPLTSLFAEQKAKPPTVGISQVLIIVLFLIVAAGVCYFALRFLQTKKRGPVTRKFLIEQLSYCALGPKAGVSLLKIGKEFALVGITANQINILSSLPKLQEQYDEESQFERGNFKDAVREEFERLKGKARLST